MRAYSDIVEAAPEVEPAKTSSTKMNSGRVHVDPPRPSEEIDVGAAPKVEPANYDPTGKFPPAITLQNASHLSVATLRSGLGVDFESKAAVIKGRVQRNALRRLLPCIYDQADFVAYGEVCRYVVVKGNVIFVYGQDTDPSPLYTIEVGTIKAMQQDPKKPAKDTYIISPTVNCLVSRKDLVTIILKDPVSNVQTYQMTFDTRNDKSIAKRFMDVVTMNKKEYEGALVDAEVIITKK